MDYKEKHAQFLLFSPPSSRSTHRLLPLVVAEFKNVFCTTVPKHI